MKNNLKFSLFAFAFLNLKAADINLEDIKKNGSTALEALNNNRNDIAKISFDETVWTVLANIRNKDSNAKLVYGTTAENNVFVWNKDNKRVFWLNQTIYDDNTLLANTTAKHLGFKENDGNDFAEKTKLALDALKKSQESKSNIKWWVIGGIIALAAAGIGYYLYSQNQSVDI